MAETTCPSCKMKLRVPDGKTGLVTCPTSRDGCGTKFYHPEIETRTIRAFCSRDGSEFDVIFGKDHKSATFKVKTLAKLKPRSVSSDKDNDQPPKSAQSNADGYDWGAFYCPCCSFVASSGKSSIVHCGHCQQIVCGGRGYRAIDDRQKEVFWFVCYPKCGHEGPVTGKIQEYTATKASYTKRASSGALPDGVSRNPRIGKA